MVNINLIRININTLFLFRYVRFYNAQGKLLTKPSEKFYFENLLNIVKGLPEWILEALFIELMNILKEKYSIKKFLDTDRMDVLQLYVPELTEYGLMIIQRADKKKLPEGIDKNLVLFLQTVEESRNIVDICIQNHWTLEQCSMITFKSLERNFIKHTITPALYNVISYISGNLKIGEFLIRKNKLDDNTLEYALKMQDQMFSSFGEKNKIVEILVNMGKVKQEEVIDYLNLKESSKNYFVITQPETPETEKLRRLNKELTENINSLTAINSNFNKERSELLQRANEAKEQLSLQLERNNMLQKKVAELEKSAGSIFKKF